MVEGRHLDGGAILETALRCTVSLNLSLSVPTG